MFGSSYWGPSYWGPSYWGGAAGPSPAAGNLFAHAYQAAAIPDPDDDPFGVDPRLTREVA